MLREFWTKAGACVVYLTNWAPTKSVHAMTPQEAWNGIKPRTGHFKVLESILHMLMCQRKKRPSLTIEARNSSSLAMTQVRRVIVSTILWMEMLSLLVEIFNERFSWDWNIHTGGVCLCSILWRRKWTNQKWYGLSFAHSMKKNETHITISSLCSRLFINIF